MNRRFYRISLLAFTMVSLTLCVSGQEPVRPIPKALAHRDNITDSLSVKTDSTIISVQSIENIADSTQQSLAEVPLPPVNAGKPDTIPVRWAPDSKKAMWLAIAIPGGGQIYNRKYWKLPIIYGGFIGCVYALKWNNTMYSDYSQAYIDIMDDDPNTKSYENFVPIGYDVKANEQRLKDLFKRKKDYYRRYRDLSMFCMIGVYALSILDAYVDAELSSFDIDKDLSLKIRPSVITSKDNLASRQSMMPNSYGVQCSLSF